MDNIINPSISKKAKILLDQMFYNKIIDLAESTDDYTLSKQLALKHLQDEIELFIHTHPKSKFNIHVTGTGYQLSIVNYIINTFYKKDKLYKEYKEEETTYTIEIVQNWSKIEIYQHSIDDQLIKIK